MAHYPLTQWAGWSEAMSCSAMRGPYKPDNHNILFTRSMAPYPRRPGKYSPRMWDRWQHLDRKDKPRRGTYKPRR